MSGQYQAIGYTISRPDAATMRMVAAFAGAPRPVVSCETDPRGRTPQQIARLFHGAAGRNLLLSYPFTLRCDWPVPGDQPAGLLAAILCAVAACPRGVAP